MENKRSLSPVLMPDLQAMLLASDAEGRALGFTPHTLETFLYDLQMHAQHPQAAHQNVAPQNPREQDLHLGLSCSQGAPIEGASQKGHQ